MADKDLKPHGVVDPTKKNTWLKEVKVDAARNTIEHLRRQKEAQEFEQLKARGVTVEEIVSKGREDLDMAPREDEDEEGFEDHDEASDADEVAELKKELQKERAARTRAENKLKKAEEESEPAEEDQPEKSQAGVPAVPNEEEKN